MQDAIQVLLTSMPTAEGVTPLVQPQSEDTVDFAAFLDVIGQENLSKKAAPLMLQIPLDVTTETDVALDGESRAAMPEAAAEPESEAPNKAALIPGEMPKTAAPDVVVVRKMDEAGSKAKSNLDETVQQRMPTPPERAEKPIVQVTERASLAQAAIAKSVQPKPSDVQPRELKRTRPSTVVTESAATKSRAAGPVEAAALPARIVAQMADVPQAKQRLRPQESGPEPVQMPTKERAAPPMVTMHPKTGLDIQIANSDPKPALKKDLLGEDIPLTQARQPTTDGAAPTRLSGPAAPATAEVARQLGGQMAVAVTQNRAGVTEVALSPQELGKVRMTMTAQDNAVVLSIVAERPETQDLMRRHIDHLQQEFRNLGFQDIKFSFGSGSTPQEQKEPTGQDTTSPAADADGAPDEQKATPNRATDSALDLRL